MRTPMLQEFEQERCNKVEKELEAKLQEQMDAYNEIQRLLQFLHKDKGEEEEKMKDVKAKDKQISVEKNSLKKILGCHPHSSKRVGGGVKSH